ncbi:hypothetical protein SAMN05421578_102121 [Paenibacillus macquariensis]|uniref:Uncharacterized protein n=1 Tax=Paenibacillus macquariensis TaxID=948756 RepID=A0ABY1JMP6_9BACL|nr:hypothetical protein SAMN05421578_102121 [Paenibacillus macquariensis]
MGYSIFGDTMFDMLKYFPSLVNIEVNRETD